MGFAAVARVTDSRWVCLAVNDEINFGLKPGGELKVETTICHEVRQNREAAVIDHVAEDEVLLRTPDAGAVWLPKLHFDADLSQGWQLLRHPMRHRSRSRPSIKNATVIGMFKLFAELIAFHLDAGKQLAAAEANLLDARTAAELHEQFVAVLGHDLRNPLAAIGAGTQLLQKTPLNEKARSIIAMMDKSVVRMSALIGDVLDLARGRLGGGITLARSSAPLEPVLRQVIEELQSTHPDRAIAAVFNLKRPVVADRSRIGQLFSNLLGNALIYGAKNEPVQVTATTNGKFALAVINKGAPIPVTAMDRLFQPFSRGGSPSRQQGLGLGLYIASEIARAHGGTIDVKSSADETCFTFSMPLDGAAGS